MRPPQQIEGGVPTSAQISRMRIDGGTLVAPRLTKSNGPYFFELLKEMLTATDDYFTVGNHLIE
jgi:hypothetical protein